jgi:hypothetical protein
VDVDGGGTAKNETRKDIQSLANNHPR